MKAIDLFGGFGGFTLAAFLAGVDVVWAGNHWRLAVDVHAANHPHTQHVCQDLKQANWSSLPDYDLLLASPSCTGHSEAAQPNPRPKHDEDRATAWAVVGCVEATRPRAFIVENIPRFARWVLFPHWWAALETLGYTLTKTIVLATDHDVPQRRERLFVVGLQGRTFRYAAPAALRNEPAFGPHLELDAPGWRPLSEMAPKALERVLAARRRQGRRFLGQHVTGHPGVPLHEPVRTITTKDQWFVVDGDDYRPFTLREYARAQSFPDTFKLPDASREDVVRGIGNAVPVLAARDLIQQVRAAA